MATYIVVFLISLILFIILSFTFAHLKWSSIFNIGSYSEYELFLIMFLNLIFILLNFILKIVAIIYYSLQKSSTVGLIQISNQLFNLIGLYFLNKLDFEHELVGISLVYGLGMLLSNFLFTLIVFNQNKELKPSIKDFNYKKIKILSSLGIKYFIIQIASVIIFITDNIIITKFMGPSEVTPYNITFKVFSIILMLSGIIITPLWSAITKACVEKDIFWLKKSVEKNKLFEFDSNSDVYSSN